MRSAGNGMPMAIRWLAPVVGLGLLVGLWWLAAAATGKSYLLPGPAEVAASAQRHSSAILQGAALTAGLALGGFALAMTVGVAVAWVFAQFRLVRTAFEPFTTFLQTTPVVAIASILIYLVRGHHYWQIVFCAFFVSLFPVITNATAGLTLLNRRLVELFELYNASAWRTWAYLRLPSSLPHLMAGAKIASGASVIGAIVGEYTLGGTSAGHDGLGYLIFMASGPADAAYVFALTAASMLLGTAFFVTLTLCDRLLLARWTRCGGQAIA